MRLGQIALAAGDLEVARRRVAGVLGLGTDFLDPIVGARHGVRNAVWPVGDTFLEVVSPQRPGTAAGRFLERRGGDGGYMVIVQIDDMPGARARIAAAGVRVVAEDTRDGATFAHLHPKDVGGAILSVDVMTPPDHWAWGGPDWRANVRTEVSLEIVAAELAGDDPAAMAATWGAVLDVTPEPCQGGHRLRLDRGELRFVTRADGRSEGLAAFDVLTHSPDAVRARARALESLDERGEVQLCGARVNLVTR